MPIESFERNQKPLVVLLGASNLTRAVSAVVDGSRSILGAPADYYFAFGNGRSYGWRSRVFFRDLPGIAECGLWQALHASASAEGARPVYALACDIGNDLLYQASVEDIEAWLRQCLTTFAEIGARTIVVQLPLANVHHVTPAQFQFVKKVLFPRFPLDLPGLVAKADALAARIEVVTTEFDAALVEQRKEWYGFDPIHYRPKLWPSVWREILSPWSTEQVPRSAPALDRTQAERLRRLRQWAYLRSRSPERRWLFGIEQATSQPCGRLDDGSTVSVF